MAVNKLFKSGNSLVVAIPGELREWLRAYEGDLLTLTIAAGSESHYKRQIIIRMATNDEIKRAKT